jgi:lipoprotein-releasing system permease protein
VRLVLFLALKQLWARKLLNAIAIGGVALGVLVLIGLNGIMEGFQQKFKGEILKVSPHVTVFATELASTATILERFTGGPTAERVLHQQPSDRTLRIRRPRDLIRTLSEIPGVETACGTLDGQAIVSVGTKDEGVSMRGVVPGEQDRCTPLSGYVEHGSWSELGITNDGVILGVGVADDVGAKVGDRVRLVAPGGRPLSLEVVGIFDAGIPPIDNSRVYVNLTTAQTVLRRPNVVGTLDVRLHDPNAAPELADRIESITGYDAESWQESNANFLSLFDMQNAIISFVITAIMVVGGFGILAIQIMIVLEKTRDIAILRSVGLRRRDILGVFLAQGAVIAIVGAALGDLGGWRLIRFLGSLDVPSQGLVKSDKFLVYEDPRFYVIGVIFALALGLLASLLPAWRGSKVEPVDVLRGQIG